MKLNHMICPTCGHDFYVDAAYATCDACQTHFYAASSRTANARPIATPFTPEWVIAEVEAALKK